MSALPWKIGQKAVLLSLLTLCVFSTSCRKQEEIAPPHSESRETIRIGLIPEQNIFSQRERYKPLAHYLSNKVGVNIELVSLSRYGNLISNFVSNNLDGAFFGSFTGALAQKKLGVEALARPEYPDGTSTYHGLVFVRKDSGIKNAKDMKGKRFAFVDKATTAGWLLPLYYFKKEGIVDPRSWLGEMYFTGTHEGAIRDVLDRKADIGAAKNTVFYLLAADDPRISNELMILTRSPNVPENALCVRSNLDPSVKAKLKEALLNMDQDKEGKEVLAHFGAARFIETTAADYNAVFEFASEIGLDLERYDYMNE